jgi:hypothetical protein
MVTSTNGSMELMITEPHFLPSLLKSHPYYHESSDYVSKETEYNNSKNKTSEVKLRIHNKRPVDIHHQQQNTSIIPTTVSKINSSTIDESLPVRIKTLKKSYIICFVLSKKKKGQYCVK